MYSRETSRAVLTQNQLRAFNKELKPQAGKKLNHQQMWAVVTTLGQYLNRDASMSWMMVDDSTRCERLNAMLGCLILTALSELDRIGQFKADSKFLDLGHVMALFLLWSKTPQSTLIEYPLSSDDEDDGVDVETVDWQETLVAYAERATIDLSSSGVTGISDILDGVYAEPLEGKAKAERWKWTVLVSFLLQLLSRS